MNQKKVKQFLKASFGNIVEWYDFSLFAYYTAAMGAVFFPKASLKESIAGVFLIFGVGFVLSEQLSS